MDLISSYSVDKINKQSWKPHFIRQINLGRAKYKIRL